MSENGADVSWDDVGKVLEEEMSSTEDCMRQMWYLQWDYLLHG